MERTAVFDSSGHYRYRLDRRWDEGAAVAFIMLNPSRADHRIDDPTIRSCLQFASLWGYGSLTVVNLFGYRTPYPTELKKVNDPIGTDNDAHVMNAAQEAETIVLAWGNAGGLMERDRTLLTTLAPHRDKLKCLLQNRSGQPRHPLYVKRTQPLKSFRVP